MSTYIVNKSINSEGRKLNFIEPGIHDNVELMSIECKTSPLNNNPFVVFTFEKNGKKLTHTEFEPSDKDETALEEKRANQIIRFKHIATKFMSEDDFDFEANTWVDFVNMMITKLKGKFEGKKVRIKVIYSAKGYTTLPRYVPFIERMSVPKEQSKLEISSIDKMTKDIPDKVATDRPNPYKDLDLSLPEADRTFIEEIVPVDDSNDDLPF